jgi:hypothetical protein
MLKIAILQKESGVQQDPENLLTILSAHRKDFSANS